MVDVRLPEPLRAGLEALVAGQGGGAARWAASLSSAYRASRPSAVAVTGQDELAAYLATRMPATYAAVATVLAETGERLVGFAPKSLLDAGAGPGTASWAAIAAFPELERVTLLDNNAALIEAARQLATASGHGALAGATFELGDFRRTVDLGPSDLVVTSYALTETADDEVVPAAQALWARCSGLMVIIEPGRPRDYQRLMRVRSALVATGARVLAPCPHEGECPLPEGDWCHFSVRLPRSRSHRQAKEATLGYEDEKFSYLVVARPQLGEAAASRVIKPPVERKFEVVTPLCTPAGLVDQVVSSRDRVAFKAARKHQWGDALD